MRSITRGVGWLLIFLVVQVSIAVVLKIAAASPGLRMGGTVLGAALPVLSTYLLMRVFAHLPSYLAQGLGVGLGFVGSQFAVAAVDHRWLTVSQISGALLATTGMFLLSIPAKKSGYPEEVRDVAGV